MSTYFPLAKGVGVAFGLAWQQLGDAITDGKPTKSILAQVDQSGADRFIVHSVKLGTVVQSSLGLFVGDGTESEKGIKLYALGALAVHALPQLTEFVLAWRVAEDELCVCVVIGGIPVQDQLCSLDEGLTLVKRALAGEFGRGNYTVVSNDCAKFENAVAISNQDLLAQAKTHSLLQKKPLNWQKLAGAIVMLAVLLGAVAGYKSHAQAQAKLALENELAASDPVPPYQAALVANLPKLGLTQGSLVDVLQMLNHDLVVIDGWVLKSVDCGPGQCSYTFIRSGGLNSTLTKHFRTGVLQPESTVDTAILRVPVPLELGGVTSIHALPEIGNAVANVNLQQTWKNAGINFGGEWKVQLFQTWPKPAAGDISRLPSIGTVKALPIEVSGPFALAGDLISTAPAGVWWQGFTINLGEGSNDTKITITLKGNIYVQAR